MLLRINPITNGIKKNGKRPKIIENIKGSSLRPKLILIKRTKNHAEIVKVKISGTDKTDKINFLINVLFTID